MYWVDESGASYGPFSIQEDEYPNTGEVLRYFRRLRHMSAKELAGLLGDCSPRWVTEMETKNKVYENVNRRRILAGLLGIPPALFGLASSSDLKAQSTRFVDMKSLEQGLDFLHDAFASGLNPMHIRSQLEFGVTQLTGNTDKASLALLAQYYRMYSKLERDTSNDENAARYVKKANDIASEIKDSSLVGATFLTQGYIPLEQGDYLLALPYLEASYNMLKPQKSAWSAVASNGLARALSLQAKTEKDRSRVETLLDETSIVMQGVRTKKDRDGYMSTETLHTNRGRTFLNMSMFNRASDELDLAEITLASTEVARIPKIQTLQATLAMRVGDPLIALSSLQRAYKVSLDINSISNVNAVKKATHMLASSRYGNMREIKEFAAQLQ